MHSNLLVYVSKIGQTEIIEGIDKKLSQNTGCFYYLLLTLFHCQFQLMVEGAPDKNSRKMQINLDCMVVTLNNTSLYRVSNFMSNDSQLYDCLSPGLNCRDEECGLGGWCEAEGSYGFTCHCPAGRKGRRCYTGQ